MLIRYEKLLSLLTYCRQNFTYYMLADVWGLVYICRYHLSYSVCEASNDKEVSLYDIGFTFKYYVNNAFYFLFLMHNAEGTRIY